MAVFDATGSSRKALAVFSGGSHSMFTDRSGTGGADPAQDFGFMFGRDDSYARRHPEVWARMTAMADTAEAVLETVESELPTAFPAKLWEAVAAGIGRHAATFRSGVTRRDAVG